jgi:hypothetical protein
MKPISFPSLLPIVLATLCVSGGMNARAQSQALVLPEGVKLGAAGWMQYSVIGNSSAKVNSASFHDGAFDGKSILSPGAQLTLDADISKRLHIGTGIGVVAGNSLAMGPLAINGGYALSGVYAYVPNAYFKYKAVDEMESKVSITGGLFSYDYNPEVRNLGLYLLRGTVYPGILISGFETKHTLPVANMLGLQVHHQTGKFQQDFLLSSEMEYYPFFDLSPAYVANYQAHSTLRVGAGVNFYHLIPVDGKLTQGLRSDKVSNWNYVDTTGTGGGGEPDTTNIGYNGTKLMANAAFDPKPLFGGADWLRWLGPEDLKLYGEIALIGLNGSSAYKKVYGDYSKRMPVMVGFNFPTFRKLDHLSLEVEWYGSNAEDNLDNYTIQGPSHPVSPFPTNWDVNGQVYTQRAIRDNWKWSLHGARMVDTHIQISFQVANDHYRPGIYHGYGDSNPPYQSAVLVTPKDWYVTTKLAYFF